MFSQEALRQQIRLIQQRYGIYANCGVPPEGAPWTSTLNKRNAGIKTVIEGHSSKSQEESRIEVSLLNPAFTTIKSPGASKKEIQRTATLNIVGISIHTDEGGKKAGMLATQKSRTLK